MLLHGHMLLVILKWKKLLKRFMKKNCQKQIKKSFEKVIKRRKVDKLYFKWKGSVSSFNSWIDEKNSINE